MASRFIVNPSETVDANIIGLKAKNLNDLRLISPEFIVLASSFYAGWKKSGAKFLKGNVNVLSDISKTLQKNKWSKAILRSSCTNEELKDRGKFLTEVSGTSVPSLKKSLLEIYHDFKKSNQDKKRSLAIIIQEYKEPRIQGHLSNERRVDVSNKIWIIEKEFTNRQETTAEKIHADEYIKEFDYSINKCLNAITLAKSLKLVAGWFSSREKRVHIEWLWDGTNFWIVQVDYEQPIEKGTKPANDWYSAQRESKNSKRKDVNNYEVFETIQSSVCNWYKKKCVKSFADAKLPYWDLYILENANVLQRLSENDIDLSLASDLKKLLTAPIIVRSDVKQNDRTSSELNVLLPRTETIYDYKTAIDFLVEKAKYFITHGFTSSKFCFLIHRFIPSNAGALSYALPNIDRVRIDSTWGIVEGLYFHPHDSFEIKLSDNKINKKIRCKNLYIDFDKAGNWYSKNAGIDYDWRQSLTDHQLRTIAKYSQELANYVRKPITIMFFINDKKHYPEILPWIYHEDELLSKDTNYTNVIFSDKRIIISSKEDFNQLIKKETTGSSKVKLLIKLNLELSRDKKFIEDIASFSKRKNYVVDIEGSILSHPYYVFHSMGVHVRCVDPFEPIYNAQEFHKLVRDKIPVLIESHQEQTLVTKVAPSELLHLLKEKAIEEALELYWSKSNNAIVEEMADLLEVIVGACKAYGLEFEDIKKIAKRKRDKRGGFENGVILVATKENSLFQLVNKRTTLFAEKNEIDDVKLRPAVRFFQKGEVSNFKSLTEVEEIRIAYVNNYASKGNKFRYLLKKGDYNVISIEYREKDIILKFENFDLEINPSQLKLL